MSIKKNIIVLLLTIVLLVGCVRQQDNWVLRVNEFEILESQFKDKFYRSINFRDKEKFSVDDLIKYADRSFVNDLLFTVEGYSLNIHREDDVKKSIEERKIRTIGRKNGPLFDKVIDRNLGEEEAEEQIKIYMNNLIDKYNFEISTKGAALFITLCQTPRDKVREILYDDNYEPNPNLLKFVAFRNRSYTVADIIKNHSKSFNLRKKNIKGPQQVEQYIIDWLMPDLLLMDAEELGLLNSPDVQQELLLAERNIIRGECKKRLTMRRIQVSKEEVDTRYEQEQEKWQNKSETSAKIEIRKRIRMEKGMKKQKETIEVLREKYKVEYNSKVLTKLSRDLTSEKIKSKKIK